MPDNPYRWVVSFIVKKDLSVEFQKFMEETHFKTIHASECFTGVTRKVPQADTKPGFDTIVYIHEPKSPEHWQAYCSGFRINVAVPEFEGKYASALQNGDISMIQTTGELTVLQMAA